jgi:alkylated DNA repair dioxygenase AlkB
LLGADIRIAEFCRRDETSVWLSRLREEIAWERHRLRMFGRDIDAPRLSCWIGDPDAVYTYSRTRFVPHPWTSSLTVLRERVESAASARFNSVLANLYRDGDDAMGWHSDSEPELGKNPVIASLSFGATRRFRFRHKRDSAQRVEIDLESGSLLLMEGSTQENYRHDLPRTRRDVGPRINLTFRLIHTAK